ncbi:hypothetical protein N8072_00950 [bacterium]|nr:hypothetical protein [bacterium]MDB4128737.1 hypothetical protein [bacterium]MDC1257228.1 hypothetical protein [bacterium]
MTNHTVELTRESLLENVAEYTPVHVLALALETYEKHGFVRSGQGYVKLDHNGENGILVQDSKTMISQLIVSQAQPTEQSLNKAKEICDKFQGKFMMKKMNGTINDFEGNVAKALNAGNELTAFQIAIIASIPNMNKVDEQRAKVEDKIEELRFKSAYFGELKTRYDISVDVLDCKFIQSSGVYMITAVHNNQDVIKFWWRDQPDINDLIEGKTVRVRGTVHRHEIGRFSNSKETMLNRVKIH